MSAGLRTSLRALPWWTVADATELDVLLRALLEGIYWHLERCPIAKAQEQEGLGFWCRHLSAAVEEVTDWRNTREAYSRAVWLRPRHDELVSPMGDIPTTELQQDLLARVATA